MSNAHLTEVLASEEGSHIGALFDFDGTIIAGYSATAMLREKFKRGEMGAEEIFETLNVMAQYSMGQMGFSGLMTSASQLLRGATEESYYEFGEELYEKRIAKKVYPEARQLVEAHLAKGHTVAIVSSATIYQIEPTARDLDIEYVCCSRYEVKNGVFTGNIQRPLCFGEGKVLAAEKLADQTGIDLDQSFFYSDSDDDIELLERVGKPRPLTPNSKLEKIANERGWPVQKFSSRGSAGPMDYARTLYATGSLVGSALAALPMWAMTGSQREATNFAAGLFGDVASAIAGIKLEVTGEENLWKERPCVFVFNHQSKADVMIMAKLVRKDMGGIGKKEIKTESPIIGAIMEFAGTVFIDRENSASAIDAMRPLVEAILEDGKSICVAPEGTRTLSPKLAPFKKGAFHLAMQAGVPVVPIVIHNAGDIAPKGEFIIRPAKVKVDVLPPVSTAKWTAKNMDAQVNGVRNMFLRALGQEEQELALEWLKSGEKPPSAAVIDPDEPRVQAKAKPASGSASKPQRKRRKAAAKPKRRPASSTMNLGKDAHG